MVCKEDVLSWFKDLDSYKRIDVLHELLIMCLPFELRFIGSCVEELGKHSFQELRGPSIFANDIEKLSKDTSLNQTLLDESVRHRVLIYLSLLSSRNYSVANWLYKSHLRTEWVEEFTTKNYVKDENLLNEMLLLYTMALHHPAFSFEQKLFFGMVLARLLECKENKSVVSPKPSIYGYPPGFGYPTQKNMTEVPTVPVKTAMPMSYGDFNLHQQAPGLTHLAQPPLEFITTLWPRPGLHCGAPEMPPFPPPPAISPLVSQAGTPSHSRSTSPQQQQHRVPQVNLRVPPPPLLPTPQPTAPPTLDVILPPQMAQDPLSHSSLPIFGSELKLPDDELTTLQDSKQLMDTPWAPPGIVPENLKHPNGMRFPSFKKLPKQPYLLEQMQQLNLEGENSLYHSNSSSNSSLNQTPPETPSATSVAPHGPGRGSDSNTTKPRVNGIPFPPPPCGESAPLAAPPPAAAFNNCSVPYSYPATFTAQLPPPNRSLFQYSQPYCRFTTPPHFPNYQNHTDCTSFSTYTPYMSLMYSSPHFTRTPACCYNCGGAGHIGSDCTQQNIEDITQKKTYILEYAPPPLQPQTDSCDK